MLVGKKVIILKTPEEGKKNNDSFYPLFLKKKDDPNKVKIMGTSFKGKIFMVNPDMSQELDSQFDFVNKFTCTRVRQYDNALLVETFLRDEYV